MKKIYLFSVLALASTGFLAFQNSPTASLEKFQKSHLIQSGGGQSGLTGAPGENNCTQCHAGTAQDGSVENVFVLLDGTTPTTSYTPGNSYTATLSMDSDPAKKGFSSVALDGTNTNAGSFTGDGIGGTQDFPNAGRQYVSHTITSNTSAQPAWAWTWTAPATDVGDVTFYIASNASNNGGTPAGDVIYLSQHVISAATASISEVEKDEVNFTAGFNPENSNVVIDFNYLSTGNMHFNLVDMNGRSVMTYEMGESSIGENHEVIALPGNVKNGMYVVHFFVDNKAMSANILVQR